MTPLALLRAVVPLLRRSGCQYAVAGGLAAALYRREPRLTQDVDVLLLASSIRGTQNEAEKILGKLKFSVGLARASDLNRAPGFHKRQDPVVMLVGRKEGKEKEGGLDVLLPTMPWVVRAIERAQCNLIDFGFGRLPTITPEDLIVAKALALTDNPSRYKDLDDLQSIFEANLQLDFPYLVSLFELHRLWLPRALEKVAPKPVQRASRSQSPKHR
ncbi:MAG TPA: nucleotidyl transferase AbiEii/AbiGii toxin family protein [Bdellovibrionota bacterium]|nr:nucleotidyl transferase AbiEii/AbiGii toxin family protein [Bdellovibrionota bacterium]